MKIKGKILTIMISLLFSVVSVSIIAVYFNFNNYITENTLETQYNMSMNLINAKYDGDWNIKDNKLYKGDFLINDNFEIVDLIKGSSQSEVTIFLKDTRVTTTIIEDDKRVIGTKADAEIVSKVLIYSLVIFIISLLMVNIFTAKVIIHPILKTSKYLDALSNGDLTFRISDYTLNRKDEFGIMANSLLKTKLSLKDILKKLRKIQIML